MNDDINCIDGFLDNEINSISKEVRDEHYIIFNLAYEINRFSNKLLFNEKIEYEDDVHVFIVCSFIEIHRLYQSAIILFEKGLPESSRILMRSIFERLFKMKAVNNNKRNFNKIIWDSKYLSKKFNDLIMEKEYFTHLRSEVPKQKDEKKYIKTTTQDWAKLAGMDWEYDTGYRLLSTDSHGDVKSMKENIVVNDDGTIITTNITFKDIEVDMILLINLFIDTLKCFITYNHFNKYENSIIDYVKKIKEINGEQST